MINMICRFSVFVSGTRDWGRPNNEENSTLGKSGFVRSFVRGGNKCPTVKLISNFASEYQYNDYTSANAVSFGSILERTEKK